MQALSGPAGWAILAASAGIAAGAIAGINAMMGGVGGGEFGGYISGSGHPPGDKKQKFSEAYQHYKNQGLSHEEALAKAQAYIKEWEYQGSDIPYMKLGGIITRPTLAMVGEAGPEAVIPLREYISQPGNVNQVSVDRMVARAIEKGLAGIRVMVGGKDVAAVVFREGYRMKQVRI